MAHKYFKQGRGIGLAESKKKREIRSAGREIRSEEQGRELWKEMKLVECYAEGGDKISRGKI